MSDESKPTGYEGQCFKAWRTYEEVAAMFGISVNTLYLWVKKGRIEPPTYFGASARFSDEACCILQFGPKPAGTYKATFSVRRKSGKKGGKTTQRRKRAADKKLESLDTGEVL